MICNNYLNILLAVLTSVKLIVVNLLPQYPRAFKSDYLTTSDNHIIAGSRVPAFSSLFVFHAEFTESGDQHVFAGFQGSFDEFEQYFDCFVCFLLGVPVGFNNGFIEAGFGEGAR